MSLALKKHRLSFLVAFLLILSLALLSWDVSSPHPTSLLERTAFRILYLPLKAFSLFSNKLSFLIDKYIFLIDLKEENLLLREEVQRLRNDNRSLQMLASENERLRRILQLKEGVPLKAVAAEIIGEDPSGWYKILMVDKGSACGISLGNGVLSPEGIVGRVLDLSENISKVILIVDKNSSIDAMIERTRGRGIVEGRGRGLCELKYVPIDEDVKMGDQVVTSGLEGIFPKGCPIGTVTRVIKKGCDLFQYIEISPAVNFSRIEEVLVTTH